MSLAAYDGGLSKGLFLGVASMQGAIFAFFSPMFNKLGNETPIKKFLFDRCQGVSIVCLSYLYQLFREPEK